MVSGASARECICYALAAASFERYGDDRQLDRPEIDF
jgi:hypothetical protein